jgi:hypothetical protein
VLKGTPHFKERLFLVQVEVNSFYILNSSLEEVVLSRGILMVVRMEPSA